MIYQPSNIIKCLSSQAAYINIVANQMLFFTDMTQIFVDTTDNHRIPAEDIIILYHERERNNFIPSNRVTFVSEQNNVPFFVDNVTYAYVYVIETNSLYKYEQGVWTTLYGKYGKTTVAQTYYPNGNYQEITADDVTTNGILNDGSVVVRDGNKMICGLLRSDGYMLDITGMIGGQININPSGEHAGDGTLSINANTQGQGNITFLNGDLIIFGNIYRAAPEDWAKQYRLITEPVQIVNTTIIKTGSIIKATSILGGTKYTVDERLYTDVEVTTGVIAKGSKIYKDSVINNQQLQPPFLFDIDKYTLDTLQPTFDPDRDLPESAREELSNGKGEDEN